jgi:hypothetical protein
MKWEEDAWPERPQHRSESSDSKAPQACGGKGETPAKGCAWRSRVRGVGSGEAEVCKPQRKSDGTQQMGQVPALRAQRGPALKGLQVTGNPGG